MCANSVRNSILIALLLGTVMDIQFEGSGVSTEDNLLPNTKTESTSVVHER